MSVYRSNEHISKFKICVQYAEKAISCLQSTKERSLSKESEALILQAIILRGRGNLGLSKFREALQDFEHCLSRLTQRCDWMLKIQSLNSLAELYLQLRDQEKVNQFFRSR